MHYQNRHICVEWAKRKEGVFFFLFPPVILGFWVMAQSLASPEQTPLDPLYHLCPDTTDHDVREDYGETFSRFFEVLPSKFYVFVYVLVERGPRCRLQNRSTRLFKPFSDGFRSLCRHAGQLLAADHPKRLPAHRAFWPRGHVVRRRRRAVHLRRCHWHCGCESRGLLAVAGMMQLVCLRGYLNDLWLFSRQAG